MFGAYTHSRFPVYWGASLFRFDVWKPRKHGCVGCCHFDLWHHQRTWHLWHTYCACCQEPVDLIALFVSKSNTQAHMAVPRGVRISSEEACVLRSTNRITVQILPMEAFTHFLGVQVTVSLFVGSPLNCVYVGGIQPELLLLQEWFFQC